MGETYLTGGLHFGDEQVLRYEDRPFVNVKDMDEKLIENWNKTVSPNDTCYVLGDVGVYDMVEMKNIVSRLNGRKILITSERDAKRADNFWRNVGFDTVLRVDAVVIDQFYVLSDTPPNYMNRNVPWVWIYAHVRRSEMYQNTTSYSACVSSDRWDYTPVNLKHVKSLIAENRKND
ncbi:phosphoesterase [bacterium]|nr:phosphoesterase [bacterium]